jgi:hypothetical protein
MRKMVRVPILIIIAAILLAACSENKKSETKEKKGGHSITLERPAKTDVVQTSASEGAEEKAFKRVSSGKNNIQTVEYDLNQYACPQGMIAPEYMDDKRIVFTSDEKGKYEIVEFLRHEKRCRVLYRTKGIGNLTGLNGEIFWTEYDTTKLSNLNWTIKHLNLSSGKMDTIATGSSFHDTPAPTIRTGKNAINWIEYQASETQTLSKLVQYDLNAKKKTVLLVAQLSEGEKRNGEYFIIQAGAGDRIQLYKSIFKDGKKSFNISLYDGRGKLVSSLLNKGTIIDFSGNDRYFAYSGAGSLRVLDLRDRHIQHVYQTDNQLTTDTPIFINEKTLIFRYAMNDLLVADLEKDTVFSLLTKGGTVSKPIFYNGYLAYAVIYTKNGKEQTAFYVAKVG